MKRLRVLYLIDSLSSGGAQRQLVTLLRALDIDAVEAEVAIYHPLFHFLPEVEGAGVAIHLLGDRGARDPMVLVRLARLVRSGGYDVVHSYLRTPGILARLATLGTPVATIVSERNVDIGRTPRGLVLERSLAGLGDAMIANAEAIRRTVLDYVPRWDGRIHVVPNGIDWTEPDEDERAEAARLREDLLGGAEVLVGTVARMEPQKNPHLLLDAIELLPDDVRERTRFVWVGAWTDRALVESVRERLSHGPLEGRLRLLGPTPRVRRVYLALDGLALSSDWEGCPNAVLEALAHGRPVVSTDVGDVSDIVRPGTTGWVVPVGDARGLSEALSQLVSMTSERRDEMGTAGSADVLDRYSTERLVQSTLAVYRRVLDERRGRQ